MSEPLLCWVPPATYFAGALWAAMSRRRPWRAVRASTATAHVPTLQDVRDAFAKERDLIKSQVSGDAT